MVQCRTVAFLSQIGIWIPLQQDTLNLEPESDASTSHLSFSSHQLEDDSNFYRLNRPKRLNEWEWHNSHWRIPKSKNIARDVV